jgi:hypothetical protein
MATTERGNWLERLVAAWGEVPVEVLWRGYWETPKRIHEKNWGTWFYFLPFLLGIMTVPFYPDAKTPIPTLAEATVYEGSASILPHPSQGIGTIQLKLATGERISFLCRYGAMLKLNCVSGDVLTNWKAYQGKPAKVWGTPPVGGLGTHEYIAVQIEIDGVVVRSYKWSVQQFGAGGLLHSNDTTIYITRLLAAYTLWVLLGFPYLNYRHWKQTQEPEGVASRHG